MDFFEAMQLMKIGKRVRMKAWSSEKFIGVCEQEKKIFGKVRTEYTVLNQDELELPPCISFTGLIQGEWEEFID